MFNSKDHIKEKKKKNNKILSVTFICVIYLYQERNSTLYEYI